MYLYKSFNNDNAKAPLDLTLALSFSNNATNDVQTGPTPTLERIELGRLAIKLPRIIAIEPLVSGHSLSF